LKADGRIRLFRSMILRRHGAPVVTPNVVQVPFNP